MTLRAFASTLLPALLPAMLLLGGCGSSDDDGLSLGDATAPAKLDTAEEAAQAAAYIGVFLELDEATDFTGFGFGAATKLELSDNCETSGSFRFTDENPRGSNDYRRFDFNNCREESTLLDGALELECLQGSFDGEGSCRTTQIDYGQNSASFRVADSSSELRILGDWRLTSTQESATVSHSLELRINDQAEDFELVAVSQSYRRRFESDGNGGGLYDVDGRFGLALAGDDLECNSGMISVTTLDQVRIDNAGRVRSGRVEISNDNAQSAIVTANDDGSVTVQLNGATTTVPRSRFERFCSEAS